jgi:hypothetical protein
MTTLEEKIAENDITLTVSDARNYFEGCIPGWQAFSEAHGFDWKHVTRHGLKASQLVGTGDAMAIGLVEWKYNEF